MILASAVAVRSNILMKIMFLSQEGTETYPGNNK